MSSIEILANQEYKYGFVTDIESDMIPRGLSEDTIRLIVAKKNEPEWMLAFSLKAYRNWLKMTYPWHWANVTSQPTDYENPTYYSPPQPTAPKTRPADVGTQV